MQILQRTLSVVFPNQCALCTNLVDRHGALCPDCWRDTPFLTSLVCDACGVSLPGEVGETVHCDDCIAMPRPWGRGRAALGYRDGGRRIVLALKHSDRTDLAGPAGAWMQAAGRDVLKPNNLLVPVPAHRLRLITRRYNQAAELARVIGKQGGFACLPDALVRTRRTIVQDGMGVEARFANLAGSIMAHPKKVELLKDRHVCLIDDVMTSGATLSAASQACLDAGAAHVSVLVLARVEKTP